MLKRHLKVVEGDIQLPNVRRVCLHIIFTWNADDCWFWIYLELLWMCSAEFCLLLFGTSRLHHFSSSSPWSCFLYLLILLFHFTFMLAIIPLQSFRLGSVALLPCFCSPQIIGFMEWLESCLLLFFNRLKLPSYPYGANFCTPPILYVSCCQFLFISITDSQEISWGLLKWYWH